MVKVLDFGVAAVPRTDVTRLTSTGRALGTRPYMSPGQIKSAPVNPRSDRYALGCVLHELVAGRRVFDAVAAERGQDSPTVLELRLTHVAALFLGGAFRRAGGAPGSAAIAGAGHQHGGNSTPEKGLGASHRLPGPHSPAADRTRLWARHRYIAALDRSSGGATRYVDGVERPPSAPPPPPWS